MLTSEQLEKQLDTIVGFLELVHPSLTQTTGFRPAVELRPISRGLEKGKASSFALSWSLRIWSTDDAAKERLQGFLQRHNGQQTCLFYSVFTYRNGSNENEKSSHINSKNSYFTEEIALDFDNMDAAAYQQTMLKLNTAGVDALWVASGHGYQAHILLAEPAYDKNILETFVNLMRSKGFDCDPHCIDAARVMRLPGTLNNKCFADDTLAHEREHPPACTVVHYTTERYGVDELLDKLHQMPADDREYEQLTLYSDPKVVPVPKENPPTGKPKRTSSASKAGPRSGSTKQKNKGPEASVADTELVYISYPYISEFELPDAVERMLKRTPQGYRNKVLGFLINFFRQNYKLSNQQCYEIMKVWAELACEPPYTLSEFEADFKRFFFTYRGLPYDSALTKQFGVIDFEGFVTLRKKNYIYIPNKFFAKFADMDGHLIRVYLAIKMLEHDNVAATQDAIAEALDVTKRTVITCLPELIQQGHCYKTEGNRRQGIPNTYHTSHIGARKDGYMSLSYAEIQMFIRDLNGTGTTTKSGADLKLYLFFRWKFFSGDVYMAQSRLAEHLGLSRTAIGKSVKRLEEQHYIKITKVGDNPLYQHCEYTLLR